MQSLKVPKNTMKVTTLPPTDAPLDEHIKSGQFTNFAVEIIIIVIIIIVIIIIIFILGLESVSVSKDVIEDYIEGC